MNRKQDISAALLGVVIGTVLWVTVIGRTTQLAERVCYFKPFHSLGSCLYEIKRMGIKGNFLGNIILFVPIGFFFPVLLERRRSLVATYSFGLAFSITIEIAQFATKKGTLDIDDVILNVVGLSIGYAFFTVLRSIKKNKVDDQLIKK